MTNNALCIKEYTLYTPKFVVSITLSDVILSAAIPIATAALKQQPARVNACAQPILARDDRLTTYATPPAGPAPENARITKWGP